MAWIATLTKFELSFTYPFMSLSFVFVFFELLRYVIVYRELSGINNRHIQASFHRMEQEHTIQHTTRWSSGGLSVLQSGPGVSGRPPPCATMAAGARAAAGLQNSDPMTSQTKPEQRRVTGVLSRSFMSWLEQVQELINYIDERRRDFDAILMDRLRRHYESYAPQTPKPKKRKRKRKAKQVIRLGSLAN